MSEKILFNTKKNWSAGNFILLNNQIGVESDTKSYKIGDGITTWNALKYKSYNGTMLYINALYI
jgi:hypothetical protein